MTAAMLGSEAPEELLLPQVGTSGAWPPADHPLVPTEIQLIYGDLLLKAINTLSSDPAGLVECVLLAHKATERSRIRKLREARKLLAAAAKYRTEGKPSKSARSLSQAATARHEIERLHDWSARVRQVRPS